MDAISRNTASVAQDFHKAGGVHELKLPANHQLLFNNKLPSQWTTKEAAALLQSLSNANNLSFVYQQQQQQLQQQRSKYAPTNGFLQQNGNAGQRQRQHSLGDDENTPSSGSSSSATSSSDDMSPIKMERSKAYNLVLNNNEQRKAMSKTYLQKNYDLQEASSNSSSTNANDIFISAANNNINNNHTDLMKNQECFNEDLENQEQLIRSSPAFKYNSQYYKNNNNNNNSNLNKNNKSSSARTINNNHINNNYQHRLDLQHNKENNNNATFLTQMEFQNLNKIGTQFQNYVKDIISKYYAAETPVMFPNMPTATTTAQQSQQRTNINTSPKRKRMLSETEEYIEYLKNKEDITLTITPKNNNSVISNGVTQKSPIALKRERDLASDSYKRIPPKKQMLAAATAGVLNTPSQPPTAAALTQQKSNKKSISQLATLLPLLADAASQQQYLTAPLDFSKKPANGSNEITHIKQEPLEDDLEVTIKQEPEDFTLKQQEPQDPTETQTAHKAYANFSVNALLNNIGLNADKRSSRKQAQPKKMRVPPEMVIAMLRDKYLNRMVDHKLSCKDCINSKRSSMLVFNYHTKASLCLHRLWKHSEKPQKCKKCGEKFKQKYNLKLHQLKKHRKVAK